MAQPPSAVDDDDDVAQPPSAVDDDDVAQPPSAVDDDDVAQPPSAVDDDDDTGPDDDDDTSTTTTTVTTTTTTSTTTTTRPGDACNPEVVEPVVIERETPFGPWPEFEERGITFRQIISSGAGEGPNDVLVTSDGLVRVLAQDGRSLDVIAVGPDGEVSREVVDPRGGVWKVLGKDADDHLYAVYTVHTDTYPETYELRAATNKSGAWERTVLFSSNDDGNLSFDMAVDAAGLVHIIYAGRDDTSPLHYATWDGQTFNDIRIAGSLGSWRYADAMALDGAGEPHALISESTGTWHWRRVDGVWAGELIRGGSRPWDLAADANGDLHAALSASGDLLYGRYVDGVWSFENVDDCQDGVSYINIEADAAGAVYISYTDGGQNDVLYATNATGEWQHTFLYEEIDTEEADFGHAWDMASALDANGHIHIVHRRYNDYYYSRDSDLNLTSNASGEWARRRLIKGSLLKFSQGVLDAEDRLHLAFTRNGDERLFYGLLDVEEWSEELLVVSVTGPYGVSTPRLQLDDFENVHVSYTYGLTADTRQRILASSNHGSWTLSVIGDSATGFSGTLFRIDEDDAMHFIHNKIEESISTTEYGKYMSNEWTFESLPEIRFPEALIFNSSGQPSLVYRNISGDDAVKILWRENDGTWTDEIIDTTSGTVYSGIVAEIGSDSVIRLSYMFQNDYRFASNENGIWNIEQLGLGKSSSSDIALTLDSLNQPRIVLYAYNGSLGPHGPGLYYLRRANESWERVFIDEYVGDMHPVGVHVKSDGTILTYYDYFGGQALMTATFEPGIN